MKKIFLLIPLIMLGLAGCKKNSHPTVYDLGVDVQSDFKDDVIQVYIDDQALLNTKVTTNHVWSLATSVQTANTDGNHTIKVIVNDEIEKTENFTQSAKLYVGINFDKATKKIRIVYSALPFAYD